MSLLNKSFGEFLLLYTEYSTSRVKTQPYFKEQPVYTCEMQEMMRLTIFSKSSNLIFITTSAWC